MTAPFELPDRIQIWDSVEATLLHNNVPARVVPMMMKWITIGSSGTNTSPLYISHWVDLDSVDDVIDPAILIGSAQYTWDYDAGVVIKLEFGAWVLKLRLMYMELRYTNTDNFYVRYYCSRLSIAGA